MIFALALIAWIAIVAVVCAFFWVGDRSDD